MNKHDLIIAKPLAFFFCIHLFFDDVHKMHICYCYFIIIMIIFNYIKYILNNGYFDLHTHSTVRLEIFSSP